MKSMKKLLLVAILLAVVVVSVGSCSAGFFDFLGGSVSGNADNTNVSGGINLAAAAS